MFEIFFLFKLLHLTHFDFCIIMSDRKKNPDSKDPDKENNMATRVTIQDIADALGLSRNTVSKAINNTGVLAEATRERVLRKAREMGYKQFSYITVMSEGSVSMQLPEPEGKKEIALLTGNTLAASHFASTMLDKFQRELAQLGYSLTIHHIIEEEITTLKLPVSLDVNRVAGIACVELFDYAYCKMLCDLGLPTLLIDSPANVPGELLEADRLYMDNQTEIFRFIREMKARGKTKIGFIGEYMHCRSFFERYMSYRNALLLHNLPFQEKYCVAQILDDDFKTSFEAYRRILRERIRGMDQLPDVFICANDFFAVDTINALKELGYSVPADVWVCGFDDSPESRVMSPSLTTIHIHSQVMGFSAVQLLMSRIKEPSLNYRTLYTETNLVFRESTGD